MSVFMEKNGVWEGNSHLCRGASLQSQPGRFTFGQDISEHPKPIRASRNGSVSEPYKFASVRGMLSASTVFNNFIITWAIAVGLFGLAGTAEAVKAVEPVEKPFINVSTTPDILDLGIAPFAGSYELPAALTVDVESNCTYGPILISTTALKRRYGGVITPERISVKTPATGGFVAMSKPVAISKSATGSHKIVLDFKVQTEFKDPAGEYTGTVTLTVTPPS
ncbi:MAG: hypothetical protein ACYTFW_10210 [Planctomycetota bacterium]|jgi:hypothetical protein